MGTSLPASIRTDPDVARLFPNYVELEKEYYRRTKIYPSCIWSRSESGSTKNIHS